jgi:NAD(P)-dependent dehydrogenase (short-subunit alcohol dehydrogenase family)
MKNIVIIGAGNGIGLKTVEKLHDQFHVISVSRKRTPELDAFSTDFYEIDVCSDNLDVLAQLPEEIHGLVYCPGSINLKPFNRLSQQDFMKDLNQNVFGAINVIQYLLPRLKKAEGASVVLFSTVAVKLGMPFHASIAVSKGAIEGLTRSLAAELAVAKVRVNAIAPSLTDTSLAGHLLNTTEKREAAAKRHPLQRVGTTDDMANLVEFLLSDSSTWLTGQVIGADGGLGSIRLM